VEPVEVVGRPHYLLHNDPVGRILSIDFKVVEHCKSEHASKDCGVLRHNVLYLSTAGHQKQGELALLPNNPHESKQCGYSSGRE
jgi:hypothetical protein